MEQDILLRELYDTLKPQFLDTSKIRSLGSKAQIIIIKKNLAILLPLEERSLQQNNKRKIVQRDKIQIYINDINKDINELIKKKNSISNKNLEDLIEKWYEVVQNSIIDMYQKYKIMNPNDSLINLINLLNLDPKKIKYNVENEDFN